LPISAQCDDCGKKYVVSSTLAGKRAKCKVCGNVFRIGPAGTSPTTTAKTSVELKPAAPALGASVAPPSPPPPPLIKPTDFGIATAFTRPVAAPLSPAAARVALWLKLLSWVQLRWWMAAIAGCYCIAIGLYASPKSGLWKDSLLVFPVLACLFLLLGVIHASGRALIVNNEEQIAAGDVLLINFQFVMVVFLRLRTLAYRRTILRADQYKKFYRQMLGVLLRAICLAAMSGVLIAAKSGSKSMPTLEGTQKAIQNFFDDSHRHHHHAGDADTP
jgi:ribosomal protein S27E